MTLLPTSLVLFDIDYVLYNSPDLNHDPDSYYSAQSFGEYGEPGFDQRWNLDAVISARRALQADDIFSVILSYRPAHSEMLSTINNMLHVAGLKFHKVFLRPITLNASVPEFKAMSVRKLLLEHPEIKHISMYDSDQDSLNAVADATGQMCRDFTPVLVSDPVAP